MSRVVVAIPLVLVGALLLWGSIKVVDRPNGNNTLAAAAGWSLMLALAGLIPVIGLIVAPVVFFMVCFRYYDLGVVQALGVVAVLIGLAAALGGLLTGAAG